VPDTTTPDAFVVVDVDLMLTQEELRLLFGPPGQMLELHGSDVVVPIVGVITRVIIEDGRVRWLEVDEGPESGTVRVRMGSLDRVRPLAGR